MRFKWSSFAAIAAAFCLVLAGSASAHDSGPDDDGAIDDAGDTNAHHQHGGTGGHLPASSENVSLVGRARISQPLPGRVADVAVFGDYAYLGAFWEPDCKKGGVYVFDISDPTRPQQRNFIRTSNDSFVGEGVQVIHIDTPAFEGDVLAMNNEICGTNRQANGGMSLVDVTNPVEPVFLTRHAGDVAEDGTVNEIHSVFIWDAGDAAYAVLVDDEETTDVDIMDITDPSNPVMVREYDLAAEFPQILQEDAGLDSVFNHDMIVREIDGRQIMLLSYWDGGYVTLDVTDPANATYVGDTDFTFPDPEAAESGFTVDPEGNGHQAEFTLDNQYIVAADEDFGPFRATATNTTDGTEFSATQGSDTPALPEGGTLEGTTVFVGRACPGDPAVPAATGPGQFAVVERGLCTFTEKMANVEAAGGYEAVIVFNREGSDACTGLVSMLIEGSIPALFVGRDVGFDFFNAPYDDDACQAGDGTAQAPIDIGTVGDTVSFESFFDGWGYVHLYANETDTMTELDTYAIPEAHDPAFASGFGDLSVHETATSLVDSGLAYFSYYAGGFRVARVTEHPDGSVTLDEVGHFIDEGGNNFWGVQVFERDGHEYVAASDRDFGLYIFEYTGP